MLHHLRLRQVRLTSRLITALGHNSLVDVIGRIPGLKPGLVGCFREYPNLDHAREALAGGDGHESVSNIVLHSALSERPRPSDYPVFHWLADKAPGLRNIFDLGGNVGNLFYYYPRFLHLPTELRWTVLDLPAAREAGKKMAAERNAKALYFASSFSEAAGSDLLLASGSAHYFDTPLWELIASLAVRPTYVIINRSPMTDRNTFATVQDAKSYRVACAVRNRAELKQGFRAIGYRCVADWDVPELSLHVPFRRDNTLQYTGMFFERADH